MNSTISIPSYPRKQLPSDFWQTVCLNIFSLCGDCLVSAFTNETKVSSPVIHTMGLRYSSPSLWYRSKKVKAKAIICILSIFGTNLAQNLY
jgi:hypothetical protein